MDTVYNALVFPLLLLVGQTIVALGQRRLNMRMDEGEAKRNQAKADTDAKRAAEAEWREHVVTRLDQQDERIETILTAQCSQMRSDILHKAHRYIDDLGCASTEEKEALWAEWEDYSATCDANNITNHFIDKLANQVMALPNREEDR